MVSRLTKCIGVSGGRSFAQSVEQAQSALAAMAGEADAHLSAGVERVQELARQALANGGEGLAGALQVTAAEIAGTAGMFGRPELCEAAKLLGNLLVETEGTAKWSPRAIAMFADAIGSIYRGGGGSPKELAATLQVFYSRVLSGAAKL